MEQLPKRRANRLSGFDYSSPGAYFVTICTKGKECSLGRISDCGAAVYSPYGLEARELIAGIPVKFPSVRVEHSVVMPNHIHLLLYFSPGSVTLGSLIAWYKYTLTKNINIANGTSGRKVLQRSFHDHVIRNEKDYRRIWEYIDTNIMRWKDDCFYFED